MRMLLEQTEKDFKADFLLRFTKELIEHTGSYQKALLEAEVRVLIKKGERKKESINEEARLVKEIQKRGVRNVVQEKMAEDSKKMEEMYIKGLPLELEEIAVIHSPVFQPRPVLRRPALRIPELQLPETVRYLRPMPTSEAIDIGILNILVQDPLVKIIECNGPGENILVGGVMGRKPTAIKLSQEEIEEIIGKFSSATKIPVHEGLFKAAAGSLVLSAVVSDIAGIKFVIRKISLGF